MGDDDERVSLLVNLIFLMPKIDYVKLVIDARYPNSVTDLTNYSWPLEPKQMIMTRVNGKVFSVSDLSCAYRQIPLSPGTQKLTSFIIGGDDDDDAITDDGEDNLICEINIHDYHYRLCTAKAAHDAVL